MIGGGEVLRGEPARVFQQFQFGLGGAYGMLLLGISVLFAIVYTVMSIRRERDE